MKAKYYLNMRLPYRKRDSIIISNDLTEDNEDTAGG